LSTVNNEVLTCFLSYIAVNLTWKIFCTGIREEIEWNILGQETAVSYRMFEEDDMGRDQVIKCCN
jgi:hypothetical protein